MPSGKIILVGTSHISKQSLKEIRQAFEQENPDIIAVELDRQRLFALLHNVKSSKNPMQIIHIGFKGYLFATIGSYIQRKLGNIVGIKPGSDMLLAVSLARKAKKPIALIDQDISITLRNFSKNTKAKDKWRFLFDLISIPFKKQKKIFFNIEQVPDDELILFILSELKVRYPSFHKVLIEDRNVVMAKKLEKLAQENPEKKILCVVGAGHRKAIAEKLGIQEKYI